MVVKKGGNQMLIELNIENLAIIENVHMKFAPGMTVLSGEEGSGKSLIVDSLGILMGTRTPAKLIRNGKNQATIEGVFALSSKTTNLVKPSFREIDIEPENDGTLVITRDMHQQGRSVSRINGRAVPQSFVRKIGQYLVDIHGQLDYISILDNHHQLNMLDAYSDAYSLKNEFSLLIDELRARTKELSTLESEKSQGKLDLLRYQVAEIEKAALKPREEEELQLKLDMLQHAETLKDSCSQMYSNLYGDDRSATVLIAEALSLLKNIGNYGSDFESHNEQLNACMCNLEDMAHEFKNYSEKVDMDVEELSIIEQRLNLINSLKRKYGNSIEEVNAYYNRSVEELDQVENISQRKQSLSENIKNLESKAAAVADKLSQNRQSNSIKLAAMVNQELEDVGLPMAKFNISLIKEESNEGLLMPDKKKYSVTRDGLEKAEYMISTNPGEPMRPLKTIASGGETSRIMLAVKSALKKVDPIPTLVFDEIDAGIGGRSGDNVGRKLLSLSRQHQVICITHLPQIACFADSHVKIAKSINSGRASTSIQSVEGENRVEELAEMLGSSAAGKTMLKGAEKLLDTATQWKNRENTKCASLS
jgi:DNA repair protein RecN (Recombination protein N)